MSAFYGLGIDSLRAALKGRANEHSIVLGLEFGKTQIVLGGDLPHRSRNGSILPHGWKYWKWIETSAPQLSSHHAFKVSHHGSAEAIPPFFRRVAEPPPEWLVTPFVREHLPRFGDDETGGLRQLLRCVPEVRLTSSVGLVVPPIPGAHVLRSVLHTRFAQVQERGFLGGLRAPSATNAFDFAWGVSFDAEGIRRHLFAGRQAITAVETIAS